MHSIRQCLFGGGLLSLALVACGTDQVGVPDAQLSPTETTPGTQPMASFVWQLPASMPNPVRAAAAVWDGSRLYVLGGDAGAASPTTLNQIYNPATDSWTLGAGFAGARDFAAAAALADGVHLVGGAGAAGVLANHRVYKRSSNTWSSRAPLRTAVDAPVAQAVGGKLYVIGGGSTSGPTGAVQIFNSATNVWTVGAPMPTPRLSAASAKIAGKIYVAGGQTAGIGTTAALERYDPATNTWTTLTPMPAAREALGGGQINGQFCVFGGRLAMPNPTGSAFAETFCYDPASNVWNSGPDMLAPRVEIAAASTGSTVYSLGGRSALAFATQNSQRLLAGTATPNVALDFVQSYVNVPDNPALDLTATWTLEAWVHPRAAGNGVDQDIISKWAGNPGASYILQIDHSGVIRLVTSNGTTNSIILGPTLLANNTWQHVAATFDNGTVLLYLNGVLDQTATGAMVPYVGTEPVAFGREGNFPGGTLNGIIDEVRIWNVVRTASDLATFKGRKLVGSEPGLVGYWRFDEGTGQVVRDATGMGNDGTLGTTPGVDPWDPTWTTNAPVIQ